MSEYRSLHLKVASVQMEMKWTLEENLSTILSYIDQVSGTADLLLFPELSVTGFHRGAREECSKAIAKIDLVPAIADACRMKNVSAWIGMPTVEDQTLFNAYVLISDQGIVMAEVRKNGLTATEAILFKNGVSRATATLHGHRMLPVLCREIVDLPQIKECLPHPTDIVVWPGFISNEELAENEEQVTHEQAARFATEFNAIVLQSNWANSLNKPEMTTLGGSIAIDKDGKTILRSPNGLPGYYIVNLLTRTGTWHGSA